MLWKTLCVYLALPEVKVCIKCGAGKEPSEFHRDKVRSDGRVTICKQCKAEYDREYRKKNMERHRKRKRKYYATHHSEIIKAARDYRKTIEGKAVQKRATTKWREQNPEKYKAYNEVSMAVAAGRICGVACAVCGATHSLEAHHLDYNKPLDVTWLCMGHHKELHKKERVVCGK